ncbi:hypothetical protein M670_05005 [Schinkia azotoformans MEV2011]|uniref:Uncharacterized protein n=1 Tax=Schinkia azotoformans MEV2011 TaxID=1348973 RepID=A0A072NDR7_SCHAZ|nr:hypothetical protein M670_05005 [Schinkia azotoformans MEV2011]
MKPYWKLTYKEKFYRTLWMIPLIILSHFIPEKIFVFVPKSIFLILIWIIFTVQLIYTYKQKNKY